MSTPYLGQIQAFGFNFAPVGWQQCNGQILPINQYTALFALLGTNYGGNGTSTFGLPDLRGRASISQGQGLGLSDYVIGENGGTENVTLLTTQMPQHNHLVNVNSGNAGAPTASGNFLATAAVPRGGSGTAPDIYASAASAGITLNAAGAVTSAGGSQPHPNLGPYLTVNFCIAMTGIFPSRS
jgi:microcystin-dependent protein